MIQKLLYFFLLSTLLLADTTTSSTIDAQINQIRNADPSQRVELMNAFKQRMMQMNQEERSQAIEAMRSKMRHAMKNEQQHAEIREHTTQMQMQNSGDISHYQNMNQHQTGSQFSHDEMKQNSGVMKNNEGSFFMKKH